MNIGNGGPQRYARMLLVTQDHLMKRWDLDFFSAAMFVPEIAALGNSLKQIKSMGSEAERKLAALPSMTDDQVSATVYELIVGAACVRKGLNLTMEPENRSRKVPDFRVTGIGAIPGAIECKRRLGLTSYELEEAKLIEGLYRAVRPWCRERSIYCSLEISFKKPVRAVSTEEFVELVHASVSENKKASVDTAWGSLAIQPLPYRRSIDTTRLYSPDFLQHAFDWNSRQDEWDGILCETEPPTRINVEIFTMPFCLKWRSESEEALTKKSRGITSLWADAVKQIPDGEIGFVYIAYPEGARPALADARTRHILAAAGEFWHRWSVRVPAIVVSRLYARSVGVGMPDLIESALGGASRGEEHWLKKLPWRVFTGQ
jgi:hypothetical protein